MDDVNFFRNLWDDLDKFENEFVFIEGDFNLVLNVIIDKKRGRPVMHEKCKQFIQQQMKDQDLIDTRIGPV